MSTGWIRHALPACSSSLCPSHLVSYNDLLRGSDDGHGSDNASTDVLFRLVSESRVL